MKKRELLKATPIFDDTDYFAWIILVTIDGDTMPVSENEEVLEFYKEEDAKEWIKAHNNHFY